MLSEIFCVCEAATNQGGKINILGTFDLVHLEKTPIKIPPLTIAARIRFSASEFGQHKIALKILDPDDQILNPPAEVTLPVGGKSEFDTATCNIIFGLQGGLDIKRYGKHSVQLLVDGAVIISAPLYVKQKAIQ